MLNLVQHHKKKDEALKQSRKFSEQSDEDILEFY